MRIAFTFNLKRASIAEEAEYDSAATIDMVTGALERLGHEVALVDVGGPLESVITQLRQLAPDLIFNTAEGRRGRAREGLFPAIFEHLDLLYTGSDSLVCAQTLDKQLTKTLLEPHAIPSLSLPKSLLVRQLADLESGWDTYPCLIKPNYEGSSKGIDQASVIKSASELGARVATLLATYPDGVLVEEFIRGIDVVVPWLETVGVLEPASYRHQEPSELAIYSFDEKMHGYDDLVVCAPAEISEADRGRAQRATELIVKALGIRDLARLDFRLADDGRLAFLEINALPSLEAGASLYLSGALAGLDRIELVLAEVIKSATARSQLTTRAPSQDDSNRDRVESSDN